MSFVHDKNELITGKQRCFQIVKLLMDHGANPLQSNLKGKTPIDVAYNDDILRLLQRRPDTTSQGQSDRLSAGAQSSSAATDSCDDGTMSPPMSASPMSAGSTSPRCVNNHSEGSSEFRDLTLIFLPLI